MSNKNLGIILLSSVLSFSTAPFALSQSSQQKTDRQKDATGSQDQNKKVQKNSSSATSDTKPKSKQVRRIQTALQQKGFDPGKIDGVMGPHTKKAVADFQRQQNLYASGNIDEKTMRTLGIGAGATQNTPAVPGNEDRQKPSDMKTPVRQKPEVSPLASPESKPPDVNKTPDTTPDLNKPDQPYKTPDQNKDQKRPDTDIAQNTANLGVGTASSMEDIRQVQIALKNRGYDPGEINGMLSSDTQEAIRKFQAANNLPVTGDLDDRTQGTLGVVVKGTSNPDIHQPSETKKKGPGGPYSDPEEQASTAPAQNQDRKDPDHYKHGDKAMTGKMDRDLHDRAVKAADVLRTLTSAQDKGIPESMLERAQAIAVIPHVIKGAFGIGGRYGKGLVAERLKNGHWGAPAFMSIGGGSFGAQLGVEATDVVLVFTDRSGLDSLEKGLSVKLGADASVAAGPIGREGEAGVTHELKSGIYAYSRTRGLFAGIALDGAVLDMDKDANEKVYGSNVDTKAILNNATMASNVNVREFADELHRATMKKTTERQ